MPKFSIVVVCLNAGDKLLKTIDSVREQTFTDYEIIVKDGGSDDGSADMLEEKAGSGNIKVYRQPDTGIYDAMNQAVRYAAGRYLIFLNCGDSFFDKEVLQKAAEVIDRQCKECGIYYGDLYERLTGAVVSSNPHMDAFGCYRNVPCHQTCFYDRNLFAERVYDTAYAVRADYEHFLWCFFEKNAEPEYMPFTVASYEGGGFSETKENRKRSAAEHKEIVKKYMSLRQILLYKIILGITLAPLRTKIAQSEALSGIYNSIKKRIYRK